MVAINGKNLRGSTNPTENKSAIGCFFYEDDLLMKSGNSAVNFSIINKMALALLEKEKSTKVSKSSKRLTTALDDEYRSLVLKC
ncbi:MAG: hypothetical protein ORN54_05330 [Cyclobacteriaceae bacterium]|nr:hypothetical protein [Cyclobacteriaceae bacterium]